MNEIGAKIKEIRLKHDMTLEELGNSVDFNYSNLSKIERGERKPTIELLEKLSYEFNVDISYFFSNVSYDQLFHNEYTIEDRLILEKIKNYKDLYDEILVLTNDEIIKMYKIWVSLKKEI